MKHVYAKGKKLFRYIYRRPNINNVHKSVMNVRNENGRRNRYL